MIDKKSLDDENKKIATIFALLFIKSEPIKISKLAKISNFSETEIRGLVNALKKHLEENWSGITITEKSDALLITTKPFTTSVVEKVAKYESKEELTKASIETLSIISYFGPIPRANIDYIRGVNSSYILRSLLIRGLIDRRHYNGQYVYEPTINLLKFLGISNISELPNFNDRKNLIKDIFEDDMIDKEPNSKERTVNNSNI